MFNNTDPLVELVITAPEPYGLTLAYTTGCRTTIGVLTMLMAQAQRSVIIAAPFMQEGHGLSDGPLAYALRAALQRGINVNVISTKQGLQTLDALYSQQNMLGKLRLYQHRANVEDEHRLGSHAKFCIADGEQAYVGSANLTGPGLSEHFEMGLLVRGEIAQQIEEFWLYSVEIGLFVPIK